MPVLYHPLSIPCLVYVKPSAPAHNERPAPASSPYVFSHHHHPASVPKPIPASLRTRDLQDYARHPPALAALRKACFLVLVTGDVAQCICVDNAAESPGARTRFLYNGSPYDARCARLPASPCPSSEFHEDYVLLRFYSTLSSFCPHSRKRHKSTHAAGVCVQELECALLLFPRRLHERDLPTLARWVDQSLVKSVHTSTWLDADRAESFNEYTRRKKAAARA